MIQVDDSGWGSMVGGCLIAAYRPSTDTFFSVEIPPRYFQGDAFTRKDYQQAACEAAQQAIAQVAISPEESVEICSGFIHYKTHVWLANQPRPWKIVKVEGPFQARIEQELLKYLNDLGFPYKGSTEEYGKLFWESVRWLKGGNPNRAGMLVDREALSKTGWATFQFYKKYPYQKAAKLAKEFKARQRRSRPGWNHGNEE